MRNVLDLKKKDAEEQSPSPTSVDGVSSSPSPEAGEPSLDPEQEDVLSEATAYLKSLYRAPMVEETAWRIRTQPDELERKKEHALLATLGAVGIGVAIWSGSIAMVAIVALTVLAWEAYHRTHHEADVHMGAKGVTINGHRHSYETLQSFHIQNLPDGSHHLSLRTAGRFRPDIRLPLGDHDHDEVRAVLSQYITEEEHSIPISELFLKS